MVQNTERHILLWSRSRTNAEFIYTEFVTNKSVNFVNIRRVHNPTAGQRTTLDTQSVSNLGHSAPFRVACFTKRTQAWPFFFQLSIYHSWNLLITSSSFSRSLIKQLRHQRLINEQNFARQQTSENTLSHAHIVNDPFAIRRTRFPNLAEPLT